jgi:hypothetical protein
MYKLVKNVGLVAMIFMFLGMNSCTKDSLVSNNDKTAIQKWNPDESFVLPETMRPYQHAIYKEGLPCLFEYMESAFKSNQIGEKNGCFILSFNIKKSLYYYGFIMEADVYYDPRTWIDPNDDNDDGGNTCFAMIDSKTFDNFKDAQAWATEKMDKGYTTCINYDKETKTYLVTVHDDE